MIKEGTKIKIISNASGHNYTVGGIYVIKSIDTALSPTRYVAKNPTSGSSGNYIYQKDFVLFTETKEEIVKNIKLLETKLEIERSKLTFIEKNNVEEFSLEMYELYKYLDILNNKEISNEEKAKELIGKIKDLKVFESISDLKI